MPSQSDLPSGALTGLECDDESPRCDPWGRVCVGGDPGRRRSGSRRRFHSHLLLGPGDLELAGRHGRTSGSRQRRDQLRGRELPGHSLPGDRARVRTCGVAPILRSDPRLLELRRHLAGESLRRDVECLELRLQRGCRHDAQDGGLERRGPRHVRRLPDHEHERIERRRSAPSALARPGYRTVRRRHQQRRPQRRPRVGGGGRLAPRPAPTRDGRSATERRSRRTSSASRTRGAATQTRRSPTPKAPPRTPPCTGAIASRR